jgi:hypothetical protein
MTLLQLLKLLGIFVSFVSGLLATAFETKSPGADGTRGINRVGIVLLIMVILGSLLSASVQVVEDNARAAQDREVAAQRSRDLETLRLITVSAERVANPLSPLYWVVNIQVNGRATELLGKIASSKMGAFKGATSCLYYDDVLSEFFRETLVWVVATMRPSNLDSWRLIPAHGIDHQGDALLALASSAERASQPGNACTPGGSHLEIPCSLSE